MNTTVTVLVAVIAVAGTLASAVVTWTLSARTAREGRDATERTTERNACILAVKALRRALDAHRASHVDSGVRGTAKYEAERPRRRATRDALGDALTEVQLRMPALRDTAQNVAQATYDMRDAKSAADLERLRERARLATLALVAAAGRHLAAGGDTAMRDGWEIG